MLFFFGFTPLVSFSQTGLSGRVADAETGSPMPFTTVALLQPGDSALVKGAITDIDGNFTIESKQGQYIMRVSFVGYTDLYKNVGVSAGEYTSVKSLRLAPDATVLAEFKVEALQSSFRSDIDKRVFNVEGSVIAEGATAIDLLETLPSIQIDEEGGIRMRGSGEVLIYINGRPTNLSANEAESILAQFPANAVKNIELITNPSSRYDAAGAGGIINIILKKNERTGFNGNANVSVGTRHKYNTGVNLNYGAGKTNYFLSYNFRYEERFDMNETFRESFNPTSSRFLNQDYNTLRTGRNHILRFGMDHNISERATWGWYGQGRVRNDYRDRDYNQLLRNASGARDSLIFRNIYETNARSNVEFGVNYNIDLDTNGTKLSASASYAYDHSDRLEVFNQEFTLGDDVGLPTRFERQNYLRPHADHLFQAQADFIKPLSETYKFEAGWKSTVEAHRAPQTLEDFNFSEEVFERDDFISNNFEFDRSIHALYGILRGKHGSFGYQAGLRTELTYENVFDSNSGNRIAKDYIDLFPSVYLSYNIAENFDALVNYSRRINRPRDGRLAPLFNVQDPLNQRLGNPNLRPEYTDSYEAGLAKSFKGYFVSGTVFHRRTTDLMSRIFVQTGNNENIQTWENINDELATGIELVNQFEFAKWMDATLTGSYFYNEVIAGADNPEFNTSNYSYTLSLLTNLNVGKVGTVQIMGNYRGPMVRPQGIVKPIYGVNVGLRKEVMKGKGSVSFNVTDVFNTRRWMVEIEGESFTQIRRWDWETQIATIAFSYRFGENREKKPEMSNGNIPNEDGF